MTIVRISIRKSLDYAARPYRQSIPPAFSNDYLVRSEAALESDTLRTYAANIAQVESRLYPSCVNFGGAHIKLATPGATTEELRGQFVGVDLPELRGQHPLNEGDLPAFPPVAAVYLRQAQWNGNGRLALAYAVTAAEWILYTQNGTLPVRFEVPTSTAVPSITQQLFDAVSAQNGVHIMPWGAGESDPALRRVTEFFFTGLEATVKRKKRKSNAVKERALRRAELKALADGIEFDPTSVTALGKRKSKTPVAGVVYLLQGEKYFKIGKSVNMEKRLTQIKLQLPYRVELLHTIHAAHPLQAESYWHKHFASLRRNGEWFELGEAEVAEFKSVKTMPIEDKPK